MDPADVDSGFRNTPGSVMRVPAERGRAEVSAIPVGDGPVGYALHLGVNFTYPKHYFSTNNLTGCVNDALAMRRLTRDFGIASTLLTNEYANVPNVLRQIQSAAKRLKSGDLFILTYAGHGANCPDVTQDESVNVADSGDSPQVDRDFSDETWCLYDQMLLDDELYAEWTQFKPGVRILVILDCCHSGTAVRYLLAARDRAAAQQTRDRSYGPAALDSAADEIAQFLLQGAESQTRSATLGAVTLASGPPPAVRSQQQIRTLPRAYNDRLVGFHEQFYAEKQRTAYRKLKDGNSTIPAASIMLLAACQDSQTAKEESGHGRFTQALVNTLRSPLNQLVPFTKPYRDFLAKINHVMGEASQTPNFYTVGADHQQFFQQQTPFQV